MRTWTTETTLPAPPDAVLFALTDPEACARWAPLPFDLDEDTDRLRTGTRTRVCGKLGGVRVGFDVEVFHAGDDRLELAADGPGVAMDVAYDVVGRECGGSEVRASVSLRPKGGLTGRLVAQAAGALLSAGALEQAVSRIAREAVPTCC